ncbi:MAG: amino acid permease [Candidatus Bathyarchaeia archaeon]
MSSGKGTTSLELFAPGGFLGVMRATAFIFVVYLGGEAIAVAQAEMKNPGKTVPRAILLSSLALIIIYLAIAFVFFNIVFPMNIPLEELAAQNSPLAYVAEQFMGPAGVGIITVAGSIAALTSVNTSIMAQSRVAYALARDGYFPKCFFSLHKRFSTPYIAILAGAIFVAAIAATGLANFVAYATDFGFIIGFIFVNLSLIKLRMEKPNLHRPFKVPLYPLTPILGITRSFLLIAFLEPSTLFIGAQLFIFGLLAYYVKMVGYYRICLAIGGINLSTSAFSVLIASLIVTGRIPLSLPQSIIWLFFWTAFLISVIYLIAGLLIITK